MKKIIALLLVAVMCLSFVACGNNEDKDSTENITKKPIDKHIQAIVGTWKSTSIYPFTFNEDKTGTFYHGGENKDFTWTYNEELKCYDVASSTLYTTLNFFLKTDDGITYLECTGAKLYRDSDFANILPEHLEKCRVELENDYNLGHRTKIEFGKEYKSDDCSITFTELVVENNELNLYIKITNNGSYTINSISDIPVGVGFAVTYYAPGSIGGGLGAGCDFSFIDEQNEIKPGETVIIKTTISKTKVKDALNTFGTIVGRATCDLNDNIGAYYIDLSEYTIKQD